jgi:hypothetical protein
MMRTTLNLDDDVCAIAREHASRERIPFGKAISRLVRAGAKAQKPPVAAMPTPKSNFSLLPARGEIITSEHVRDLMD